ncbi:hypothetical protein [Bradyrhizobium sp. sGM-13]|uniref:hypothetical protein n=1 Tax=Bradyrhizobium sp. sGM-13 TaxID=2831781 RepID=UPI001BD06FE3|nr:hypothetical protein [Bradyrhizobium sp. sGM-13]
MPSRSKVFDDETTKALSPFLTLQGPKDTDAETLLRFTRTRLVPLEWSDILQPKAGSNGFEYLRSYLHRAWKLRPEEFDAAKLGLFITVGAAPGLEVKVTHPSGREYVAILKDPAQASHVLDDEASYDAFWATGLLKLQLDPAISPSVEELDLSAPVIINEYNELVAAETLAKTFSEKADEFVSTSIGPQLLEGDEIERVSSRFLRMKAPYEQVKVAKLRLKDRAADLGYVLPLVQERRPLPGGGDAVLEPGKLYREYVRLFTWTTTHERIVFDRIFPRRVVDTTIHVELGRDYYQVMPDYDPWIERRDQLFRNENLTSYIFQRNGSEFVTRNGETLSAIAKRCDLDEQFRLACAIWIPVYEQKLTKGEVLTKYLIYKRPLPGIKPIDFPQVFIREELAYKSHWKHPEIGELLNSLNLAPGEERTITIERSYSREAEERKTATSLLDVSETESLDLATEIENEAKRSEDTSRSSNWDVSAGGSFFGGLFSASGGAGGSSTTTTSEFARNVQKLARRASNSLTRRTRQEVSTSSSVRTNILSREVTTIKVNNINDGRTLNLLFYQLFNVYECGLYLEDLELVIVPPIEVVDGSNVTLPVRAKFSEIEKALDLADWRRLPILPDMHGSTDEAFTDQYYGKILNAIEAVIDSDYPKRDAGLEQRRSANVVTFAEAFARPLGVVAEGWRDRAKRIADRVASAIFHDEPISTPEQGGRNSLVKLKVPAQSVYMTLSLAFGRGQNLMQKKCAHRRYSLRRLRMRKNAPPRLTKERLRDASEARTQTMKSLWTTG